MDGSSPGRLARQAALALCATLVACSVAPFAPPGANASAAGGVPPQAPPPAQSAVSIVGSLDLVTYQAAHKGAWFSVPVGNLPTMSRRPEATFAVHSTALANRSSGRVSPTLVASYVFLQFGDIPVSAFEDNAQTLQALFIRSANVFVDYEHDRAIGWDGMSARIPMDVRGFIQACNARAIPVLLELNYSDWIPGPEGSGVEGLVKADNVAGTIRYLEALASQGLHVDGVTFGDEWGDDNGYGSLKPTLSNTDMVARFVRYATALKARFPSLKVYAFDSYIGAARGQIDQYWAPFRRIHQAEVTAKRTLLDGFVFRESYVYMNPAGKVESSQRILDDTESLYRNVPVYRYDTLGRAYPDADRDYLHTLLTMTRQVFGRSIDLGLTEYLPAIPTQLGEGDTSKYPDIDFILHYADVVGIYASLGLNVVSSWMFGNSPQFAEAYLDRSDNHGANYPMRLQLATDFSGTMLDVGRSVAYDQLKVKVYAVRSGARRFLVILNKDASHEHTIRLTLPAQLDLTVRLPRRSYTSLTLDKTGCVVSGIGN
jgi:hypothetical protein